MTKNFHGAVKIVRQCSLKVLSPAWSSGREAAESKVDRREIESSIKPASAIEADFLRIEFVEIVQHAADGKALIVVQRMLELTGDNTTAVQHQVFPDDAAGVCETVVKLFVGREQ